MKFGLLFLLFFSVSAMESEGEKDSKLDQCKGPFFTTLAHSSYACLSSPETREACFKERKLQLFLTCLGAKRELFEEFLRAHEKIVFPDGPVVSRKVEDPILNVSLEETIYEALEKKDKAYWIELESAGQYKHLFKLSTIFSWVKHGKFNDPTNQNEITSVKIWEIKGRFVKRREDLEVRFMSEDRLQDEFFKSQLEKPLYEEERRPTGLEWQDDPILRDPGFEGLRRHYSRMIKDTKKQAERQWKRWREESRIVRESVHRMVETEIRHHKRMSAFYGSLISRGPYYSPTHPY